jgi:outer membrane protein
MFKKIILIIFLIIFNTYQYSFADKINIRYVDLNFIINNSNAGKNIIIKFKKQNEVNINEFKKIEENLKKEKNKLLSQKNILEKNEYQKKISELQNDINNYKKNRSKKVEELNKKRIILIKKLITYIDPILLDYSSKNSIDVIMKKESFLTAKTELNITDDILKELNKSITKIEN